MLDARAGRMGPAISGKNAFGATVSSVSMDALAVYDQTAGRIGWLTEAEELNEQWKSGELFAPGSS